MFLLSGRCLPALDSGANRSLSEPGEVRDLVLGDRKAMERGGPQCAVSESRKNRETQRGHAGVAEPGIQRTES